MNRMLAGTIVFGVTVIAGCAFATRPVPFEASPAAWEALAGEWRGDYTMDGHDRHGIIAFDLKSAEHRAEGDVLMIPDRSAWPYRAHGGGSVDSADRTPPRDRSQLLGIHFVMAEGGQIRGSMEPYWDPDRSCQASATFIGSVDGNTIAGTFASVCEDGVRTLRGRWKVQRKPHTR